MKRLLITICCLSVLFITCKKKDNPSPTALKLEAGLWEITGSNATYTYNGKDTTIDYYSQWRPCEQDDLIEFDNDGKGSTNENTNKCPEDDQVDYFIWELQDNDSKIKMTLPGGIVYQSTGSNTSTSNLVLVNDTLLKLASIQTINSYPATVVETYKNVK